MLYYNYKYTICLLLPEADEFGTLLIGALLHQVDVKVKGMENFVDGGGMDTETHRAQRRQQSPSKHLLLDY